MAPQKIMLIRHAEKPTKDGPEWGVDKNGSKDDEELIVRGWQRAGALARLFSPLDGYAAGSPLALPTKLYAAHPNAKNSSKRSKHTLAPLATLIGAPICLDFSIGEEAALAKEILRGDDIVLVAWEHKAITLIVESLTDGALRSPHWDDARFDMILILDNQPNWRLMQKPQMLLAGDIPNLLPKY
jgi:hypothetical protein